MCAEPYLFIFLNTFKYVSAHETITLINASIILKKEEYEYSTFPNKVRHHKVQHRDQQQRFRHTLRLMTEHDLAMLYEWLNRSHIVEWWGGEEARPTLADVQEQYLPSVLAQESVTPYIAMLNGEPIGYAQSYVALGSGDGWWEEETDPGVRGIDQSLANARHNWAEGLGPSWFELWLSCCSMIPRSPRSKRTRRRATCERSDATRKRGLRGKVP